MKLTWSMACMEKLNVINSQIGRSPAWNKNTATQSKILACKKQIKSALFKETVIYHYKIIQTL